MLAGALVGQLSMPIVIIGASLASIGDSFQWPALAATIPLMASEDELPRYNGFMESGRAIGRFAGPAIGGVSFGFLGVTGLVAIELATFALATVVVLGLTIPNPGDDDDEEEEGGLWSDSKLGPVDLDAQPLLKLLVATYANFFPRDRRGRDGAVWVDFLSERAFRHRQRCSARALELTGGVLVGFFAEKLTNIQQFYTSAFVVGAAYAAYGFARGPISFAVLNFVIAAMMTIASASIMTIWRLRVRRICKAACSRRWA